MRKRTAKWFLVLGALLSLGGGPLAFAHSASSSHEAMSGAEQTSEHCAGRDAQAAEEPAPAGDSELPCCASGDCVCVAASSLLPLGAPALMQFVRILRPEDLRLTEPPSVSLRDPLRPPIG